MPRPASASVSHLDIPRKSVELQDPGAHELQSSEDEHFSDASEGGCKVSRPQTPASPIPKTRVERVDDEPAHGEVPGTPAYDQRQRDAVPDEVEVVPEGRLSKRASQIDFERPTTPGGTTIPRTVVEKVDPTATSYGDDPNTRAWHHRKTDSVPDLVVRAPRPGEQRKSLDEERPPRSQSPQGRIPETIVTPVEPGARSNPFGSAGSPTLDRSMKRRSNIHSNPEDGDDDEDNKEDLGDDFDDFEEGDEVAADDDFGDFGDEFEKPETATQPPPSPETFSQSIQPLIDFEALSSLPDLLAATQQHLDLIFPSTTQEQLSSLPQPPTILPTSPIFPSDRSRSLWKQLVTPPPLQPPNWTQSRIRRLFLVSLGVPVDLDEILPPSKQKKLVLPDINIDTSRKSESDIPLSSIARLKAQAANVSTGSVDSTQSGANTAKDGASKQSSRGRKPRGAPPPPDLDLNAVKRLCATTDEKLDGLTDEELQEHVKQLEVMTERTSEVLEYWLKRRDGLVNEKEAFEGVIENLVAHVRRVRR